VNDDDWKLDGIAILVMVTALVVLVANLLAM